jgi:hypothetical protein
VHCNGAEGCLKASIGGQCAGSDVDIITPHELSVTTLFEKIKDIE